MVLPAILNPFVEDAPAAVMTRIALDWIIDGTPLDALFDEVAEGQYTRELTLTRMALGFAIRYFASSVCAPDVAVP